MEDDYFYQWWIGKYGSHAKTQIAVADRRGADRSDQVIGWLDSNSSIIGQVLLHHYGMEFIQGIVKDCSE